MNSNDAIQIAESAEQTVNDLDISKPFSRQYKKRVLFCCPGSVLDITSGAALSLRTILSGFVTRGYEVVALQCTIFDSPQGGAHVMKAGEGQSDKAIWRTNINGVDHLIVKTSNHQRRFMNCQEEETYIRLFRSELEHRRPEFIFLWGGLVLERTIMREAKDLDIPVVFYLVNPGYKDKSVFKDVSLIITDTQATADLYKERHGLHCVPAGKFIDLKEFKITVPRKPEFVTYINPSFEKGVAIFMPLAKLAAKNAPNIKFLVVQSRGVWANSMKVLGFSSKDFPNVHVIGHQFDMKPVYASSRVILLPSLWHESGARVIAESLINGIPVLASRTGGSAELIGSGGKTFDIPEKAKQNFAKVGVTESDLQPWLDELIKLHSDSKYYEDLCAAAEKEAVRHDINASMDRFLAAVQPLINAQA